VREEKNRGVQFPGLTMVKAALEKDPPCFAKTTQPDAFWGKIGPLRIRTYAGDGMGQVYLHPTDADCQLQSQRHLCPASHPPQLVTPLEPNIPQLTI